MTSFDDKAQKVIDSSLAGIWENEDPKFIKSFKTSLLMWLAIRPYYIIRIIIAYIWK